MKIKLIIIYILIFTSLFSSNFQKGNIEFTKGNLIEAEEFYIQDLKERGESFHTLYNLGSLYLNLEREGYSKYYLKKAQLLKPRDKELNKLLSKSEIKRKYLTVNEKDLLNTILVLIFSTAMFTYLLFAFLVRKNVKLLKNLTIITLFLTIGITPLNFYSKIKGKQGITLKETMVYLSPYQESEESFNINSGEEATIKESFNDFYYIVDNSDRYGWIKKEDIGELWIQSH